MNAKYHFLGCKKACYFILYISTNFYEIVYASLSLLHFTLNPILVFLDLDYIICTLRGVYSKFTSLDLDLLKD